MSRPSPERSPVRLLRAAVVAVAVFAVLGTLWLAQRAFLNPDVRARRPRWFEGTLDLPFWLPLIVTFVLGAAAVVYVYARALRRVGQGEDLFANSYRARKWRELQERRRRLEEEERRAEDAR